MNVLLNHSYSSNDVLNNINFKNISLVTCQVNYTSPVNNTNNACPAGMNITEDTQCDFTCPTGYTLVGNSTVYCQSNGELSDQIGCERK